MDLMKIFRALCLSMLAGFQIQSAPKAQ